MNIVIEDAGTCRKKMNIEWPSERVDSEFDKSVKEFARVAKIQGFRPGKAPLKMVGNMYSKKILEDVRDRLVAEAYQTAIKENNLEVVNVIDVDEITAARGTPLTFSVTVEIAPDFDLPPYDGIKLTRNPVEVDEAKVDETIDAIAGQFASYEEVEGRAVQRGDLVQVNYDGIVEGQSIEELGEDVKGLGKRDDFWVPTDENAFLPEFGDGLIGLEVGAKTQIFVDFPVDFAAALLAGKKATYFVEVKGIRAKVIPELDEAFFKRIGVKDEAELRERIRKDLKNSAEQQETTRLRNEVIDYFLSRMDVDLPATIVANEARQIVQSVIRDNSTRGVPHEQLIEKRDEILDMANRSAESRVKAQFVLDRIAAKENIAVTPSQLENHIQRLAMGYGMKADVLRQELEKRKAIKEVEAELRRSLTLDYLMEKADISAA